jgi:hypothetical protein
MDRHVTSPFHTRRGYHERVVRRLAKTPPSGTMPSSLARLAGCSQVNSRNSFRVVANLPEELLVAIVVSAGAKLPITPK